MEAIDNGQLTMDNEEDGGRCPLSIVNYPLIFGVGGDGALRCGL